MHMRYHQRLRIRKKKSGHLPKMAELVRLAKLVLGDHVGEWSTKRGRITLATDDVLTKLIDITLIQVPPRAPRKASKSKDFGAFFF